VHQTAGSLPVGAQLVGPPAGDALLLALAAQLEAALGWRPAQPTPALAAALGAPRQSS
jgi:amidase